jgi:hypothetical protein
LAAGLSAATAAFGAATLLGATLGAAAFAGAAFGAAAFGGVLAATFEAVAFEPVAFAAVLAVLFGIELLLFFEDLAAVALAATRVSLDVSLEEVRARLLVAPRLTAAAFLEALVFEALVFETLETLFLRVFCDTACARNCHAPVRCFNGNRLRHRYAWPDSASNVPNIAHFPQKSMI